jgi:hypothetical protein
MRLVDAHSGLAVLDRDECLARLRTEVVGRLAVVHAGAPVIYPVNYVVDGEDVVFRSDPGVKADAGLRGPVCFEVDHLHRPTKSGWSVVITGRLEEARPRPGTDWRDLVELPLEGWAGGKHQLFRIVPDHVTGRQVGASQLKP